MLNFLLKLSLIPNSTIVYKECCYCNPENITVWCNIKYDTIVKAREPKINPEVMELAICQEREWGISGKMGYGILTCEFLKDMPI